MSEAARNGKAVTRTEHGLRPTRKAQRTRASRQVDYAVAIVLNLVLLAVLNVWPTWRALPFVTADAVQAVAILNLAAIVALALNLLCLAIDSGWLKLLTDFVGAVFALVFSLELWQSFPFDFPAGSIDWVVIARGVIIVSLLGAVIGMIVQLVLAIVRVARSSDDTA